MVAGHSAHSSSSAQFCDFLMHRLVSVEVSRSEGLVSLKDLDMKHPVITAYDLEELFDAVEFPMKKRKRISRNIKATEIDSHAVAWVKHLIDNIYHAEDIRSNFSYTSDVAVSAFEEGLTTFLCSNTIRPDGVVLYDFEENGNRWQLPLFILEVHSSPYQKSLAKTAVVVLEQLRLLRCFNWNIPECVGFTFPKYSVKSFVTKVTVSFDIDNIQYFVLRFMPVKKANVYTEVTNVLTSLLKYLPPSTVPSSPSFCFMRFSDDDLGRSSKELLTDINSKVIIIYQL